MRVKSMAQRSVRDQELLNLEMGLTLDEEDKLFAAQRESPRARPKDDKWVKVLRSQGQSPLVYKLFDLSRGGLGFVSAVESEFTKGSLIYIVGFNDYDLDDPLIGTIMSIRSMDGNLGEFKVGIKFTEGQD
jgi:c-di-GMP-binding flagellar brake protein YcgR